MIKNCGTLHSCEKMQGFPCLNLKSSSRLMLVVLDKDIQNYQGTSFVDFFDIEKYPKSLRCVSCRFVAIPHYNVPHDYTDSCCVIAVKLSKVQFGLETYERELIVIPMVLCPVDSCWSWYQCNIQGIFERVEVWLGGPSVRVRPGFLIQEVLKGKEINH